MDRYQQRIEAAFLAECSPEAAYDWLHARRYRDDDGKPHLKEAPNVLEYVLVRRGNPLIDLGIARYGHSIEAIRRVYRRGNSGIRCAALSNVHIGPSRFMGGWLEKGDVKELICSGTRAELESFVKNRFIDDDSLEQLLERKDRFAELSDDQYYWMLIWLGSNPRMSTEYDDMVLDGYREYKYHRVFSLAWELARSLPVTKDSACVLHELLQNTVLPINYDRPDEVLERWRIEEEPNDDNWSSTYLLRTRLADVLEADDKLLNSNDSAVKESFYRRFSPWQFKNWPTFIERDGELAFNAMVENDQLWRSTEYRELLYDLAWKVPDPNSCLDAPNIYRGLETHKRRQHPEWFSDEESEFNNSIDEIIRPIKEKVDTIAEAVEVLHENYSQFDVKVRDIKEDMGCFLDRIDDAGTDIQDKLSLKLSRVRDELLEDRAITQSKPCRYTRAPVWPWIIVIALLILILLR